MRTELNPIKNFNFEAFFRVFRAKMPLFCTFHFFKFIPQNVDANALKSLEREFVPVQVRSSAPEFGVKSSGFTPFSCLWGKIGERKSPFFALFSSFSGLLPLFLLISHKSYSIL